MVAKWEDSHQAGFALTKGLRSECQLSILDLSTQLINPKFCVSRPHRRSTTVSLETNPLAFQIGYTWVFYSAWCTGNTGIQQ